MPGPTSQLNSNFFNPWTPIGQWNDWCAFGSDKTFRLVQQCTMNRITQQQWNQLSTTQQQLWGSLITQQNPNKPFQNLFNMPMVQQQNEPNDSTKTTEPKIEEKIEEK